MRVKVTLVVVMFFFGMVPFASAQFKRAYQTEEDKREALNGSLSLERSQEDGRQKKSIILAAVYSLVLPGMGELYAGSFESGKYFLMADGGLWLTYAGFRLHGSWLRNDARAYARQHAGVNVAGKDEQFEVNLGNFHSVAAYNEAKLRNRQYDLLYDPNSSFQWNWDSDASRVQYRNLRIRSDEIFANSRFVIGAVVINRLISAFAAVRAAALHNRTTGSNSSWRLSASLDGGFSRVHGILFNVRKEF